METATYELAELFLTQPNLEHARMAYNENLVAELVRLRSANAKLLSTCKACLKVATDKKANEPARLHQIAVFCRNEINRQRGPQ